MPVLEPNEDAGPDKDTGSDDIAFDNTSHGAITPPEQTQLEDVSNGHTPREEVSSKFIDAAISIFCRFRIRDTEDDIGSSTREAREADDEEVEVDNNMECLTKQSWRLSTSSTMILTPRNLPPECVIQTDAPLLWERYTARTNHRAVLGPGLQDQWHILGINSHRSTGKKGKTVTLNVSWVGSREDSDVTEAYVETNSPVILKVYWNQLGGRTAALKLPNQG
ncbi:hypothetical protein EsH8_X_000020 [Colletotrichum jinshuiense]